MSTACDLPEAPPVGPLLAARLAAALAAKRATPGGYRPRTHHLDGDAPRFTNRLIFESSPYLLQHAHNPVDWRPWGDEVFEEARRLERPVFLSIGYATCHWCHVMEAESFEDEEIAAFMNGHYLCIKVDREERPDLDAVYMSAVQALTGSGGWPMSVWLTPAREPFFGGTYFPPRQGARGARHGFLELLADIHQTYLGDRARVGQAAESLVRAVRARMEPAAARGAAAGKPPADVNVAPDIASPAVGPDIASPAVDPDVASPAADPDVASPADPAVLDQTLAVFKRIFDEVDGGVRRAPKFPSNLPVRLLLRAHHRTGDAEALRMATVTLEKMAAGGIYDQIGGGFHRYSTDAHWLVPHFEKMLYDNALLVVAYAEAFQVTGRGDFARVARETLDYLLREMTAPAGGFYSATDADSVGSDGESTEGAFFVWSKQEIEAVLSAGPDGGGETTRFVDHYGVTSAGNFESANILHVARPDEPAWAALAGARAALHQARARRPPPLRDEKILAAWNGLAISAFAVAGRVLPEPRYLDAAARAASFALAEMRPDGRLVRSWKDGRAGAPGFLDDQAFLTAGLLDLYEASFDRRWLEAALDLAGETERRFADPAGGWFMTANDHERLIAREKPVQDGAEPSGTAVALLSVLRLQTFTSDDRWRAIADRAFASLSGALRENPLALTETLLALDYVADEAREIAVVWPSDATSAIAEPLLAVLRRTFVPNRAIAAASETDAAELGRLVPFIADKIAIDGRPSAYVCVHGRCDLPVHDAESLGRLLSRVPI